MNNGIKSSQIDFYYISSNFSDILLKLGVKLMGSNHKTLVLIDKLKDLNDIQKLDKLSLDNGQTKVYIDVDIERKKLTFELSKNRKIDHKMLDLLKKHKIINKNSTKLKILGTGEIKNKVNIEANLASKSAVEKLEKIGGSIQLKK